MEKLQCAQFENGNKVDRMHNDHNKINKKINEGHRDDFVRLQSLI